MKKSAICSVLFLMATSAFAQESLGTSSQAGTAQFSGGSIAQLLAQGFEIKAAVPNGSKFIVFLQKEEAAYACEFATLARSQCGALK